MAAVAAAADVADVADVAEVADVADVVVAVALVTAVYDVADVDDAVAPVNAVSASLALSRSTMPPELKRQRGFPRGDRRLPRRLLRRQEGPCITITLSLRQEGLQGEALAREGGNT